MTVLYKIIQDYKELRFNDIIISNIVLKNNIILNNKLFIVVMNISQLLYIILLSSG